MSYLGSKAASGVYQKIIAEMPPHDTYIETHLGSGAVMLRKPPARRNWGIDIDPETVEAFNQGNPDFLDGLADTLFIDVGDAVEFLRCFDYASAGRVLIYSDPPYLHETRSSSARYRHEYTVGDHCRLLGLLCSMPENVSVIVSGYPSSVYDNALPGWRSKEFQAMTRGGVRTEKIWMNYPEGGGRTRISSPVKTTMTATGLSEKRSAGRRNLRRCLLRSGWRSWWRLAR